MAKNLVIVESPSKGRTISRFLGKDFVVESSYGHIRDLPRSKLGVDVDNNFEPQYIIPLKARPAVKKLKAAAARAAKIILASDEDREGESIAWHLVKALGLDESSQQEVKDPEPKAKILKPKPAMERIVFHEITERAIKEALLHPREIDMKLVDAQQARRVLDRLVGYKLSPFLWKKVFKGLSAGRVQSVAVRLIVEREREIQKFKPQEYWSILARLSELRATAEFEAALIKIGDKTLDKFAIANSTDAKKIVDDLKSAVWTVQNVEKKAITRSPLPPYTTSTLQQDAFRRLHLSAKQTMMFAQRLYEGVELGKEGATGLITYMRTDSLNLSEESLRGANEFIKKDLGDKYLIPTPRRFKTKSKGAQEAHEAIRPTDPRRTPESIQQFLEPRQFKLYDLIWRRFIATQMPQAIFDSTSVEILASGSGLPAPGHTFKVTGQIMKFEGFLKIYPIKFSENALPELMVAEKLELIKLTPEQHFTEPPPRFNEASLVKTLEKYGIGRPSTYAPIISTIQDRGYVERFERRYLKPTETGFIVNDLLVEHFPQIVDVEFTAKMEKELDEVASGEKEWQPVIREFYEPFAERLEKKYEEVKKHHTDEATDQVCEKCGKPMVIKMGRYGKFLACSGFPDCKNAKPLAGNKKEPPQEIGMKCPKCGSSSTNDLVEDKGEIIIRHTRRGKLFYGCSRYPKCDWASWEDPRQPTGEKN